MNPLARTLRPLQHRAGATFWPACLLCLLVLLGEAAQAAPPPPGAPPPPRRLSPAEQRDSATAPGELRSQDEVLPQIDVPLGRTPPGAPRVTRSGPEGTAGGIDDAAARCRAQSDPKARAACAGRSAGPGTGSGANPARPRPPRAAPAAARPASAGTAR